MEGVLGSAVCSLSVLTDVVRTPQSSLTFSKVGVGALGVSINSNSDSLPLALCGFAMVTSCYSPGADC